MSNGVVDADNDTLVNYLNGNVVGGTGHLEQVTLFEDGHVSSLPPSSWNVQGLLISSSSQALVT